MEDNLKKSLKNMVVKAIFGNLFGGILGSLIGTIIVYLIITLHTLIFNQIFIEPYASALEKLLGLHIDILPNSGAILYLCLILPIACKIAMETRLEDDEFSVKKLQKNLFRNSILVGGIFNQMLLGILFVLGESIETEIAFILLLIIGTISYFSAKEKIKEIKIRKLMVLGILTQLIGLWAIFLFSILTIPIGYGLLLLGEAILFVNLIRNIIIFRKQIKDGEIKEEKDLQMYSYINNSLSLLFVKLILILFNMGIFYLISI